MSIYIIKQHRMKKYIVKKIIKETVNHYHNEALVLEVSIEQLKKDFVDTNKITPEVFEEIKKVSAKSVYVTWLTKMVYKKIIKTEDIYKWKSYFAIFERFKQKYPSPDINNYKEPRRDDEPSDEEDTSEYYSVADFIETSIKIKELIQADPSKDKGRPKRDKYKEFVIGEVDGFTVYELPKGRKDLYNVSCELGTIDWCTSTGKTRVHFDDYINQGPLYIFINPSTREKYQFHYESNQFVDRFDKSVV